ncbi:sensor domain-containing diguanylate cyclase [Vibrio parahaemolyticus]
MEQSDEISQFLDFLVDAILIVDQYSNIVFANKSCARLFGYERDVLLTLRLNDLMQPNVVNHHDAKVSNFVLNQSQARAMMSRSIMPCRNASGDGFNARISIANIVFNGMQCGIATLHDYSRVQELIDELKEEANTDALTGLFNKRHLESVLENQSLSVLDSGCLGVAYLDLNGFKLINDTFGHDIGDQLLVEISTRLKGKLRSSDICFRVGGDELLILFNINDHKNYEQEAKGIANKLHELISEPVSVDKVDGDIAVGVSIGIGIYPHDDRELSALIEKTDKAMYVAKKKQLPYVLTSTLS